jgi:hypothetical protein
VLLEDRLFAKLAKVEDRLFMEIGKVVDEWWCSDRIGNKLEFGCLYFGTSVAEKTKDRRGNIVGGGESTASCD